MNEPRTVSGGLIAATGGSVYPLSNSECIFRAKHTGERHVMTLQVLKAMDLCSRFRSFDDHVRAVMAGMPGLEGKEADTRRVLEALRQRGLFVSAEEMLALAPQPHEAPKPECYSVFIRSVGRKEALTTLLNSLLTNEKTYNNTYRYFVLDDARDEAALEPCKAVVEEARSNGLDCHWLGRAWQTDFAKRLGDSTGVDTEILAWALTHADAQSFSGGRLWNLITLAAAGEPFLMLDDDLVCEARCAEQATQIQLDSDAWDLWFHADADTARSWGEPLGDDPLARHAGVVGASVGEAFDFLDVAAGDLTGVDQRQLARAIETPIMASISGTYGDAASSTRLWLYTIGGDSRERFWASREAYEQNVRSRYVSRVRRGLELQAMSQFTPVGHAGQYILPPTLPYGRNEDSLAAAVRQSLFSESRSLEFPWALGHFPETERDWQSEPWNKPYNENLARFIGANFLSAPLPFTGADERHRYELLADQLTSIAEDTEAALAARLDEFMLFVRSDVIAQLQTVLAGETQVPVYWGADARRIIEVNGKALTEGGSGRLEEMPQDMDDAGAATWLRPRLDAYARLLRVWPELWQAAREMDALPG